MQRAQRKDRRAVRKADEDSFRSICGRYSDRVRGFALRLTGNSSDADDLMQSVFISAYAGRNHFRGESSMLSWLQGIAVRKWRDLQRGPRETAYGAPETIELLSQNSSAPADRQALEKIALENALALLDSKAREALLLVASQGLTYKEAAEAMNEPIGTVKWRVFEAMRKMRSLLSEREENQ